MRLGGLLAASSRPVDELLSFLRWRDCVSLAQSASEVLAHIQAWGRAVSADVSRGVSPHRVPCSTGSSLSSECSAKRVRLTQRELSLGGPVPPSFLYLNEGVYRPGVPASYSDRLAGCSCQGGCAESDPGDTGIASPCLCVQLNDAVGSDRVKLFECHAACSCSSRCQLRATQAAEGVPIPRVNITFLGRKGWGACAIDPLPRDTYVAEYTGEVLTLEDARRRAVSYDREGLNYVLTVQEFFQGGKQIWQTIVDATKSGNVSRFFNHSCDPTLSVYLIRRGSMAPRLIFFTRVDVEAGRELTYDYGAAGAAGGPAGPPAADTASSGHVARGAIAGSAATSIESTFATLRTGDVGTDPKSSNSQRRTRCLCGSHCCRKFLPYNRAIL